MGDSQPAAAGGAPPASDRPLGPDGKPIPGPEQVHIEINWCCICNTKCQSLRYPVDAANPGSP